MTVQYKLFDWVFDWASFGTLCRQKREESGLSAHFIGRLLGVSDSHIYAIEHGSARKASLATILSLANIWDIDISNHFYLDP